MSTEQKTAHRYSPHPIGHYIRNIKGETSGYFKYTEAWNLAWLSHDWEKGYPEDAAELHRKVMDTMHTGPVTDPVVLDEGEEMGRKLGSLQWDRGPHHFVNFVRVYFNKTPRIPLHSDEWVKTIEHRAKHHCLQDATAQSLMDNADQPITGQAEKLAQMALDKIMGKPA